jgi:DNA-binding PadR family transcriptional regulator
MGRRHIGPEDIAGQLASITELMIKVLELVDSGTATHGRSIARILEVPYPQVYYILNVLTGRRFLSVEWDENIPTRKTHTLTPVGRKLLEQALQSKTYERHQRAKRVHPDEYARQMRVSGMVSWLVRHGIVDSREDLVHIMNCPDCDRLLRHTENGWENRVRCDACPRRTDD